MATTFTSRTGSHPEEGIKAPCVVASSANITLSGEQTVNGVAVVAGDRVLVKSQTDTTENGIYIAATSAWTRATDWNNANDVASGIIIIDAYNDTVWKASFTGDYSPGTTAVTFDNVFEVSAPPALSITASEIAANTITQAKMARQTSGRIPIGQGTGADVAFTVISGDIAVTNAGVVTIQPDTIGASEIVANSVTVAELARQTSAYILIGKGTAADVAFVAVSGDISVTNAGVVTIANTAVSAAKLASDAVTTVKILDANVTEAKLSSAVQTKLNSGVVRNVLVSGASSAGASSYAITGIDADAVRIEIFAHLDPSADQTLKLEVGHGGGPTYIASGYTGEGETAWSTFADLCKWDAADEVYIQISLEKMNSNVWFISTRASDSGTATNRNIATGYVNVTAVLSALRLSPSAGTFDVDTITVVEYT